MELLHRIVDLFLHLNPDNLGKFVEDYQGGVYVLLFLIVFCETGLVVTPLLPGDSLLFAAGAVCSTSPHLQIGVLIALLIVAALLGDNTNYFAGRAIGPRVFTRPKSWFFNPEYLHYTSAYYARHGGKTVVIARFAPILRTFAPFVAGIGKMKYPRFLGFSIIGAALWVPAFILAGYKFAQNDFVRKNFHFVILAIIALSLLPAAYGFFKARMAGKSEGDKGEGI